VFQPAAEPWGGSAAGLSLKTDPLWIALITHARWRVSPLWSSVASRAS
jgi:hypothetical protein